MITRARRRLGGFLLVSGLATTLLATPLVAGPGGDTPILRLQFWVDGKLITEIMPLGMDNGNGTWSYFGAGMDPETGVTFQYTANADPDPLLSLGLSVENPMGISTDISFTLQLEIAPNLPDGTMLAGSAGLGVTTDSTGGAVGTLPGSDVWRGLIDGATAVAVFKNGFSLNLPGSGSLGTADDFGLDVPVTGPPANATIGVAIAFSLTPFDQSSMTSVFNVTGPPAAPPAGGNTLGVNTADDTETQAPADFDYAPPLSQFDRMLPIRTPDIDGDGHVGIMDLLVLIQNVGPCSNRAWCPADISGNGMVAIEDLLLIVREWG